MTYQTNACFSTIDQHEACCLFATAEAVLDLVGELDRFTDQTMLDAIATGHSMGDVDPNDYLTKPQEFIDALVGPGRVQYIDEILDANYEPPEDVNTIDFLFRPSTGFHHFVRVWMGPGRCKYDPIEFHSDGPGSATAAGTDTFVESKRGFRKV